MRYLFTWICAVAFVLAGCDNELETSLIDNVGGG